MADDQPKSLVLLKPIPAQVINEGATYGPLKLNEFFQNTAAGSLHFRAELSDGASLPKGLICTTDGIINGIPAARTHGNYRIIVTAENDLAESLTAEFDFVIKSRIAMDQEQELSKLKHQVWEALGKNLPPPDIAEMLNRPITVVEIYYLLQRFATLTIWDVYNLEYPGDKKLIQVEGNSQHYNIFDRGSCIVAAPKDLFSHERTLEDALQAARALAREVYKRGWVIEFAGFNKMVRAAWVELQVLGSKHGKFLEVLHFEPSPEDLHLSEVQVEARAPGLTSSGG